MYTKKGSSFLVIVLIIFFISLGIFFFIQAVKMSSSFSLLGGGSPKISPVSTDSGSTVNSDQNSGSSDVSSFFQNTDPFQKRCNDNSSGGTSVSSNTVCLK